MPLDGWDGMRYGADMQHIDLQSFAASADARRRPYHEDYYAMYSSIYDGITTDPVLMLVPADDHLVHRGEASSRP